MRSASERVCGGGSERENDSRDNAGRLPFDAWTFDNDMTDQVDTTSSVSTLVKKTSLSPRIRAFLANFKVPATLKA